VIRVSLCRLNAFWSNTSGRTASPKTCSSPSRSRRSRHSPSSFSSRTRSDRTGSHDIRNPRRLFRRPAVVRHFPCRTQRTSTS
jgi:hypothetical protein